MNAHIRQLAVVLLVAFVALLGAVGYWQVADASALANNPRNVRPLLAAYAIPRGKIIAGSSTVLAESVPTSGFLHYQRVYPQGSLYAAVTGYDSLIYGTSGLEQSFNSYLSGQQGQPLSAAVSNLFSGGTQAGDNLLLTLDPTLQQLAARDLGAHHGAVVALNPSTGAVLALYSAPSYNPNTLASNNSSTVTSAWHALLANPAQPLIDRATQALYPPGSTFKIITSSAALGQGVQASTPFANLFTYTPPGTSYVIHNFNNEHCYGGAATITLAQAFEVSCDTVYAHLGVHLGATSLQSMAHRYGFNSPVTFQLPAVSGHFPTHPNAPQTAQSAIGQFDVGANALAMARVAETVANGGVQMPPYLVRQVVAPDGTVVRDYTSQTGTRVIPASTAASLHTMMALVVQGPQGTATNIRVPGLTIYAKTGTSQHGAGRPLDSWFVCFASHGGRSLAVAVSVPNAGATGSAVAAPIARDLLTTYLGVAP